MGRTPLFRLLQRAAAIARASRHVRMPLDEFHDLVRTPRIDRCTLPARGFTLQLTAQPTQPLLLQGDAGYSRKGPAPAHCWRAAVRCPRRCARTPTTKSPSSVPASPA